MLPIPYGRQEVTQDDIDAVVEVLKSDFLTQGPKVTEFEAAIQNFCNIKHCVAVNSATSALHIACLALGIGKGDIVWTSPITFVASANCVMYCSASVDFIDIDAKTWNLSTDLLRRRLIEARNTNKLPKALIAVHLCGQSCEMDTIWELSQEFGFKVIEDASHAIGGQYKNNYIGCCKYSDITIFSFHPVKIITTGEGGVAVTNHNSLAHKMRLLRSHGISNCVEDMTTVPCNEVWNYQQIELGYNYRMTDLQAALGLSQIKRVNLYVDRRIQLAQRYIQGFKGLPIQLPTCLEYAKSSFHLFVIRLNSLRTSVNQKNAIFHLNKAGIRANLHYIPVYLQPFYEQLGFKRGYCTEAEKYFHDAITLPLYPTMTEKQQDYVIETVRKLFET